MPQHILQILKTNLELDSGEVYRGKGLLGLSRLFALAQIDRPDLKYKPFLPTSPPELKPATDEEDMFTLIRRRDILLHHPFQSFQPVVDFLRQAARDPDVLAIKVVLYRVGRNSPVVEALLEAIEEGKQVAVLMELKARFDEESNIEWAKTLEKAGCHVVYGLLGLKIHCKAAMVLRREGDAIRPYLHLATGNYNVVTAHLYTDIGLFTCDPELAADTIDLFNFLTGYSAKRDYQKLLVAPVNLRERMEGLIQREIQHHAKDGKGHLVFKMNALVDPKMIRCSVSGFPGRDPYRPAGARHLLPAARSSGSERNDPRHEHRGTVPGAQPDLLFPEWRQGRDLSGQRRPDAAQSQSPRGTDFPGGR